jgi:hypothetical protein
MAAVDNRFDSDARYEEFLAANVLSRSSLGSG